MTSQLINERVRMMSSEKSFEIRDTGCCPTITVYRPERTSDWEASKAANKQVYRISPAYINASSFQIGGHSTSTRTVKEVQDDLTVFNYMMEEAINLLNQFNSVILEWQDVENPHKDARYYKAEHQKDIARRAEEEQKKQARRKDGK